MMDERETVFIDLDTEKGIVKCQVITAFDLGDKSYIALLPAEETEDGKDGEILIYRYSEIDNEEIELNMIEDDEEWNRVVNRFDELMEEV